MAPVSMCLETASLHNGFSLKIDSREVESIFPVAILGTEVNPTIRAELIKSLPLQARGFDFCPEVTALVRLRGMQIHEVPIDYTARTHAEGKKVRWSDGFRAVKTLLAYRIRPPKS